MSIRCILNFFSRKKLNEDFNMRLKSFDDEEINYKRILWIRVRCLIEMFFNKVLNLNNEMGFIILVDKV